MSVVVHPPTMGRVASLQTGQSNSPNVIDDSSGVDSPPASPSPDMILASPGLSTSTDGTTRGAGKTSLPYTASEAKKAKKQREALDKEAQKQELKKLKAEIDSGNLSVQERYDELHAADQERKRTKKDKKARKKARAETDDSSRGGSLVIHEPVAMSTEKKEDATWAVKVGVEATQMVGVEGAHATRGVEVAAQAEEEEVPEELQYEEKSCICIPLSNKLRQVCINIIQWPGFDRISMTVIGLNCIALAMYDPADPDCETEKCKVLGFIDLFFGAFFTIECVIKVIAMGLYGSPGAYLSNSWNRLDFAIVIFGLVDFVPGLEVGALQMMRIFRVLRPLRAINKLPSLRVLVTLIFETIPMMGNVLAMCFFVIAVFGILAVQLFQGKMRQRCYMPPVPMPTEGGYDAWNLESFYTDDMNGGDPYICSITEETGMNTCPPSGASNYTICWDGADNPGEGTISFDNVPIGIVPIFIVITMEGWTEVMYMVQDAYSFWVWIFFFALVFLGGVLTMNLFLAVITTQFSQIKRRELKKMAEEQQAADEELQAEADADVGVPRQINWCQRTFMSCMFSKAETERMEATLKEEDKVGVAGQVGIQALWRNKPFIASSGGSPTALLPRPFNPVIPTRRRSSDSSAAGSGQGSGSGYGKDTVDELGSKPGSGAGAGGSEAPAAEDQVSIPMEDPNAPKMDEDAHIEGLDDIDDDEPETDSDIDLEEDEIDEDDQAEMDANNEMLAAAGGGEGDSELTGCAQARVLTLRVVISSSFGNFILAVIGLNTLAMASEFNGQSDMVTTVQKYVNQVCSFTFMVELVIKHIAYGFKGYWSDPMNAFDGLLVLNSVVELAMGGGGGFLTVLRALRLLRLLKLFRFLPGLQLQMKVLVSCLAEVANFCIILLLFLFIYSILGMYLFGDKFTFDGETSQSNFDNLFRAFVTVFQLITVEDWPGVMMDGVRSSSLLACVYFMSCLVIGQYILCNLFIAILLDGYAQRAAEEEQAAIRQVLRDAKGQMRQASAKFKEFRSNMLKDRRGDFFNHWASVMGWKRNPELDEATYGLTEDEIADQAESDLVAQGHAAAEVSEKDLDGDGKIDANEYVASGGKLEDFQRHDADGDGTLDYAELKAKLAAEAEMSKLNDPDPPAETSCYMFTQQNRFRRLCFRVAISGPFDKVILFFILFNSLVMAVERPEIEDGSTERIVLNVLGHMFNGVFLVEFLIKVIALGLHPVYLSDPWNRLDGFLVFVSAIDTSFLIANLEAGSALKMLKILRLLRALRPLRVINKAPKLKKVVMCMVDSMGKIGNTMIICGMVFLIFGILGMQFLMGRMNYCNCEGEGEGAECDESIATKSDCLAAGYTWDTYEFNFDNLYRAMLTLFFVCSFDGWVDVMWNSVNAVGEEDQPVPNNAPLLCMYYIAFLIVGNFFVLNLFIGVIVDSFNNSAAGIMAMDSTRPVEEIWEEQAEARRLKEQKETEIADVAAYQPWRKRIFDMVTHPKFDVVITSVICANVLCMAIEHYEQPDAMTDVLKMLDYGFTGIFFFEYVFKHTAYGWRRYIRDDWSKFDFFIVIMSFFGLYVDNSGGGIGINPSLLRVLRVFRIARVLKLVKSAKGLRALLDTVLKSMNQVASIALLMTLVFFIYACAGVQMFGKLSCDVVPCQGLIENKASFESFPMAMLTLFRVCTGDNGNGIMKDALRTNCIPDEDCDYGQNCCSNAPLPVVTVPLYFVSFYLIAQFILLNVIIAVLMAELLESQQEQELPERRDSTLGDEVQPLSPGTLSNMKPMDILAHEKQLSRRASSIEKRRSSLEQTGLGGDPDKRLPADLGDKPDPDNISIEKNSLSTPSQAQRMSINISAGALPQNVATQR